MTSSRMASELAAILVPIGVVGAVLAALCAIVAGVAIMRGAAGLAGGAVGLWIPSALLSSTASFANQWTPLVVAGAVLAATLTIPRTTVTPSTGSVPALAG
jgi:ABC-type cobalamin transport system ATPase subunit